MHFSFHFTHLPSLSSSFARKIRETKLAWGMGPSPTSYSLFFIFFFLFNSIH